MLEIYETVAKAVADPSRVRILKLLEKGELCVCQITAILDFAPATISKHLSLLKMAGLVQTRKEGKWIYYRLSETELNSCARPFLHLLKTCLETDPRIRQDREALETVKAISLTQLCGAERTVADR